MCILIVDSTSDASRLGDSLERHGHRVDYAAKATLGTRLLTPARFDVIVLAAQPSISETLSALHGLRVAHRRQIPILVVAADGFPSLECGSEGGPDGFLRPPYRPADIEITLRALHRHFSE